MIRPTAFRLFLLLGCSSLLGNGAVAFVLPGTTVVGPKTTSSALHAAPAKSVHILPTEDDVTAAVHKIVETAAQEAISSRGSCLSLFSFYIVRVCHSINNIQSIKGFSPTCVLIKLLSLLSQLN